MTLLTPLGLLGLLGIIVLIIIYIIKPNYQQKYISTTFVWKLSLKYRKRKIPVSKLRNILLILCQVLILTACAVILAQPNKILKQPVKQEEVILIIDSSASMRATHEEKTRFERAVVKAQELADATFEKDGIVSIILADEKPSYLQQRVTSDLRTETSASLSALLKEDTECSYATSDIDGAVSICEEVLMENPDAKVVLLTDTKYEYVPKAITLHDVSHEEEWNASILNAYALFEENYYAFVVEMASYGRDASIGVEIDVYGANAMDNNDEGTTVSFTDSIDCIGDEVMTMIFVNEEIYATNTERFNATYDKVVTIEATDRVATYKSLHVSISQDDSFPQDNSFDIYGGMKEVVKVQYFSEKPNNFWPAALAELKNVMKANWELQITEVKVGEEPEVEGYDFYVFEHTMPEKMPTDGVVFLVNPYPNQTFANYGIRIGSEAQVSGGSVSLEAGEEHPIGNNLQPDKITVSAFKHVTLDASYTTILAYQQYSLLAARNDSDLKVVIMPFSLHWSNLALRIDFPLMVYNTFSYYFPETVQKNSFEVNETVELKARGEQLMVEGFEMQQSFDAFPAYIKVDKPGTYVMTQTTFTGKELTERIYVRIPALECNIKRVGDAIVEPYQVEDDSEFFQDLLLYIAIALVTLLFVEWWLQNHDSI